jgi:hypothetical protein
MRSVSGNHDDGDDNQCRDQRKRAIKCFRSGPCGGVGRRHGLCRLPQVANEPADISGLHRIGRYRDFFDMIAFGAVKRAKFKSPGPRRDARKYHARSTVRAVELLNGEQWDCSQMIGHSHPPLVRRERQTPSHRQMPKRDGDGINMLLRVPASLVNFGQFLKIIGAWLVLHSGRRHDHALAIAGRLPQFGFAWSKAHRLFRSGRRRWAWRPIGATRKRRT